MTRVSLFVCIIWVALSLVLLGCQRPSNIQFDETGFYILVDQEDSIIDMSEDLPIPRIQPNFEGYGLDERRGMVPDKETALR